MNELKEAAKPVLKKVLPFYPRKEEKAKVVFKNLKSQSNYDGKKLVRNGID